MLKYMMVYTKHILIALFSLLISGQVSVAQESVFAAANEAYTQQEYQKAIELYSEILETGKESEDLYYNLGNAHYKLGNVALSILNFEKALQLNPRYDDAIHNLEMARLQVIDNIDPLPELMLVSWAKNLYNGFSSRQWGFIAIALFWLALLAAAGFLFTSQGMLKRIGFFGGIILLVFGLIATSFSFTRKKAEHTTQHGIIANRTAYIKNAPNGDQDLLILHEGAKVKILDNTGDWSRVHIRGVGIDVVGFVKKEEILGI